MENYKRERLTALSVFAAALLVYFVLIPYSIEIIEEYAMASLSPSFFPQLALILIAGLAALSFGLTFLKKYQAAATDASDDGLTSTEQRRALVAGLIIAAYLVLMQLVGFLISTPLVLMALFPLRGGVKGILKSLAMVICLTLGIYLLFRYALQVHFPIGLIFS